jgi:hypothetical protein
LRVIFCFIKNQARTTLFLLLQHEITVLHLSFERMPAVKLSKSQTINRLTYIPYLTGDYIRRFEDRPQMLSMS